MSTTSAERRLTMDGLDVQTELYRFYGKTTLGARYMISLFEQAIPEKTVGTYSADIVSAILTAPVYAVTADITDVITSASLSLPSFDMQEHDMPSQDGFIWLEKPIVIKDKTEADVVFRGFGWVTSKFVTVNDDDEEDERTERADGVFMLGFTDPLDKRDHLAAMVPETAQFMSPHGLLPMLSGIHAFKYPNWIETTDGLGVIKWFMAFSRFVGELWVDHRVIEQPRHVVKRTARVRVGEPEVRIVQLRRKATNHAAPDGEDHSQEWSHRWLVRGHWRNQWYPSIQAHRPKWIPEHIKGPDDKPLIVREKIFSVSR